MYTTNFMFFSDGLAIYIHLNQYLTKMGIQECNHVHIFIKQMMVISQ